MNALLGCGEIATCRQFEQDAIDATESIQGFLGGRDVHQDGAVGSVGVGIDAAHGAKKSAIVDEEFELIARIFSETGANPDACGILHALQGFGWGSVGRLRGNIR